MKMKYLLAFIPFILFSCGNNSAATNENSAIALTPETADADINLTEPESSEVTPATAAVNDEAEIKQLIQDTYQWLSQFFNEGLPGYQPVYDANGKAVEMDKDAMQNTLDIMKDSDLFDIEFLAQYFGIFERIDADLKSGAVSWQENEYIPYMGADPWCACQDIPYTDTEDFRNYWKVFHIDVNSITGDNALVKWYWDESQMEEEDAGYNIVTKKVDGKWKVAYMYGIDTIY